MKKVGSHGRVEARQNAHQLVPVLVDEKPSELYPAADWPSLYNQYLDIPFAANHVDADVAFLPDQQQVGVAPASTKLWMRNSPSDAGNWGRV